MRVAETGHVYRVRNKICGEQEIQFFKDLPQDEKGHDGILCQELLRVLINRVLFLNEQVPCYENVDIVNKLRESLILFETRAARRLLEKSYSKTGKHVEELSTDDRGHILNVN